MPQGRRISRKPRAAWARGSSQLLQSLVAAQKFQSATKIVFLSEAPFARSLFRLRLPAGRFS
jgi:hypothetical protein